jgi:hypothetical protein
VVSVQEVAAGDRLEAVWADGGAQVEVLQVHPRPG